MLNLSWAGLQWGYKIIQFCPVEPIISSAFNTSPHISILEPHPSGLASSVSFDSALSTVISSSAIAGAAAAGATAAGTGTPATFWYAANPVTATGITATGTRNFGVETEGVVRSGAAGTAWANQAAVAGGSPLNN